MCCLDLQAPVLTIISSLVSFGHRKRRLTFRTPAKYVNLRKAFQEQTCFVSWPVWVSQRVCYLGSPSCIHSHHPSAPTHKTQLFSAFWYHWIHKMSNPHRITQNSVTCTVSMHKQKDIHKHTLDTVFAHTSHTQTEKQTHSSMYTNLNVLNWRGMLKFSQKSDSCVSRNQRF